MSKFITSLIVFVSLSLFSTGANANGLGKFKSYADMEGAIAQRMTAKDFSGVLDLFDPTGRFIPAAKRQQMIASFASYYKAPLKDNAVVYEDVARGGFRRAIYAYWGDTFPVYLYIVTQERDGAVQVQQFDLQGTFSKAYANW